MPWATRLRPTVQPIEETIDFEIELIPLEGLRHDLEVDGFLTSDLTAIFVDKFIMETRSYSPRWASRLTSTDARYASFLEKHPEYETTSSLDELRRADFGRLDSHDHLYLDYTGGGLYGESQVRTHMEFLLGQVPGNPHSASPN